MVFVVLAMLPICGNAAVAYATGEVTQIKMFPVVGDVSGVVFYMNELPPACNAENPRRVLIRTDNPLFNAALSVALAAKTTSAQVEIGYIDQCSSISNAWDFQHLLLK